MTCGIYQIVNKVNGKRYVGSSVDIERRWGEHLRMLRGDRHVNAKLQSSFNLHGEHEFYFGILEECYPYQLADREQFHIDEKSEYNLAPASQSTIGYKHTSETRDKLSQARKRQWLDEDYRQAQAERMSKRSTEFWADPEMRAKISASISKSQKERFSSGLADNAHNTHKTKEFRDRFSGENSPVYNHEKFRFYHDEHGEYEGAKYAFSKVSGIDRSDVNKLVNGKVKCARGWRLKEKAPN